MPQCFFVSDLHGNVELYRKLLAAIEARKPAAVFMGGDLTPGVRAFAGAANVDFFRDVLGAGLEKLRRSLGSGYPKIFAIMGNDDYRAQEPEFTQLETHGLWLYVQGRRSTVEGHAVYGYGFVPPTPFALKDWERYDVSAYVDPGCVPLEEGRYSVPVDTKRLKFSTIAGDLDALVGDEPVDDAILLCHTPPYRTNLDRAALDGKMVEHVPVDVNIGSIALHQFITKRQPLLTLHGHVHEAARLTGSWRDRIGRTHLFSAAHDGPELALVRFDLDDPGGATRELR